MCQLMHRLNQEAMHLQLNMREKWLLNCLLCMQSKLLASQYSRQASKCRKCYAIGHKMTWRACPLHYSSILFFFFFESLIIKPTTLNTNEQETIGGTVADPAACVVSMLSKYQLYSSLDSKK